jgi:hypothetical protein
LVPRPQDCLKIPALVANTLDDIKEEEKQHETNVRDELALKDIVKKTVSVLMVISREP